MMKRFAILFVTIGLFLAPLQKDAGAQIGRGSPQFRAITGVSMGGYGAMNIGLGHPGLFSKRSFPSSHEIGCS